LKGKVYRALARLTRHPSFYDKLKKENGIPVMVFELKLRRQAHRQSNRKSSVASVHSEKSQDEMLAPAADEDENDFTDELVARLKKDHACIKIQACARTYLARRRHALLLELLTKLRASTARNS
jgi:hypothetical protein